MHGQQTSRPMQIFSGHLLRSHWLPTGQLHGLLTSANGKLASVRCGSKEVDGQQHRNLEASRLVRRRGHLRSREEKGRETASLVVEVGESAGREERKTVPDSANPASERHWRAANRIKQMSTLLGRLGILLVKTAVLTSAADSSHTRWNNCTVEFSIMVREYIDVYAPAAVLPNNVQPIGPR